MFLRLSCTPVRSLARVPLLRLQYSSLRGPLHDVSYTIAIRFARGAGAILASQRAKYWGRRSPTYAHPRPSLAPRFGLRVMSVPFVRSFLFAVPVRASSVLRSPVLHFLLCACQSFLRVVACACKSRSPNAYVSEPAAVHACGRARESLSRLLSLLGLLSSLHLSCKAKALVCLPVVLPQGEWVVGTLDVLLIDVLSLPCNPKAICCIPMVFLW